MKQGGVSLKTQINSVKKRNFVVFLMRHPQRLPDLEQKSLISRTSAYLVRQSARATIEQKDIIERRKTGIKSLFSTSNSSTIDKTYMRGTVLMNDAPFVRFCLNVTASFEKKLLFFPSTSYFTINEIKVTCYCFFIWRRKRNTAHTRMKAV